MTNKTDHSELFKDAVEGLISHCQEIANDVRVLYDNPISAGARSVLDDYAKVFRGSRPNKHFTFYRSLFAIHKVAALAPSDDGNWLKGGISVKCSAKFNTVKLDVSLFYNAALRHAEVVQNSLKDFPPMKHNGLIRPNNLRLLLLKAFAYTAENDEDRNALLQRIADLEKVIAATVSSPIAAASAAASSSTAPASPKPADPTAALGPLGGLFDMAATFAKNAGFQMPTAPPGVSGPAGAGSPFDLSSLGDAFKKITESGVLTNIVQNLVTEVSKAGILPPPGKRNPMEAGLPPVPPVVGTTTTGIVATEDVIQVDASPANTTTVTADEPSPPAPGTAIPSNNSE